LPLATFLCMMFVRYVCGHPAYGSNFQGVSA
jgi:hypothetical protein